MRYKIRGEAISEGLLELCNPLESSIVFISRLCGRAYSFLLFFYSFSSFVDALREIASPCSLTESCGQNPMEREVS